jgi:hypothetical protein
LLLLTIGEDIKLEIGCDPAPDPDTPPFNRCIKLLDSKDGDVPTTNPILFALELLRVLVEFAKGDDEIGALLVAEIEDDGAATDCK